MHDRATDRTQQRGPQRTATSGADHDEVGVLGLFEQCLGRRLFDQPGVHVDRPARHSRAQ